MESKNRVCCFTSVYFQPLAKIRSTFHILFIITCYIEVVFCRSAGVFLTFEPVLIQWILGSGIDQNLSIMLNVRFTHGWLKGANLQISMKMITLLCSQVNREKLEVEFTNKVYSQLYNTSSYQTQRQMLIFHN